ncbi:seipin Ecym_3252 [Eremothecium cymbalariae DBVPG|uniref:Seipin n=1 Tax=Eremothecium cymbalariae (strain CBS 270.75 / DBVPG 7215 / KCTC 17166 / NRRL Y-17582) TaxID=931890 RepID=G8JRH6_ERECY|nr:Hypothetical protein Ecym_3252 [Eremothecium cymbalariae DBVPG\
MQINILWPLQWIPWFTYTTIIIWVQVILIVPLSTMLWQEFYDQLIPKESRYQGTFHPIERISSTEKTYSWHMHLKRENSFTAQGSLMDFGAGQIPDALKPDMFELIVSKHSPYVLNIQLEIYCLKALPLETVEVCVNNERKIFIVTCFNSLEHAIQHKPYQRRLVEHVQHEYVNTLEVNDFLVSTHSDMVNVTVTSTGGGAMLFGQDTHYELNMQLEGIRYVMLRWYKTCHILGTASFVAIISGWFFFSFTVAFMIIGFLRGKGTELATS